MAICTACGAIMHNDDVRKHICRYENVAKPGKELLPTTTEVFV